MPLSSIWEGARHTCYTPGVGTQKVKHQLELPICQATVRHPQLGNGLALEQEFQERCQSNWSRLHMQVLNFKFKIENSPPQGSCMNAAGHAWVASCQACLGMQTCFLVVGRPRWSGALTMWWIQALGLASRHSILR